MRTFVLLATVAALAAPQALMAQLRGLDKDSLEAAEEFERARRNAAPPSDIIKLQRATERAIDAESKEGFAPLVGRTGEYDGWLIVDQVIGERDAICRFGTGQFGGTEIWLRGYSTKNVADQQAIQIDGLISATETKSYSAVAGNRVTLVVVEPVRVLTAEEQELGEFERRVKVVQATFGEGKGRADVTGVIGAIVSEIGRKTHISTKGLGIKNPGGQFRRQLIIAYQIDGDEETLVLNNGEEVDIRSALLEAMKRRDGEKAEREGVAEERKAEEAKADPRRR